MANESKNNLKIAVDLDGTISAFPEFFKVFSKAMTKAGCKIYVVTDRPEWTVEEVAEELRELGITFDHIEITGRKDKFIISEGIAVFFDDIDDYFLELPEEVAVFKVRQKYNFDFEAKRWHEYR